MSSHPSSVSRMRPVAGAAAMETTGGPVSIFSMTKWYLDAVADDGATAGYFYFISGRFAGFEYGEVSSHIARETADLIRRTTRGEADHPSALNAISFGTNGVRLEGDSAFMRLSQGDFRADLRYNHLGTAFTPAKDGTVLNSRGGKLRWRVPGVSCSVSGTIRIGEDPVALPGSGYIDIVETDIAPWRLPLAELHWGRAHCGPHVIVFDRMVLRDGRHIDQFHVRTEGTPVLDSTSFAMDSTDGAVVLRAGGIELSMQLLRALEEGPLLTAERIRFTPLRSVLAHTTGDPFERKLFSAAHIRMNGVSVEGFAIHEIVRWRW